MTPKTFAYRTPVALPMLDIPADAWLHCKKEDAMEPGAIVFGKVLGSVCVGRVDTAHDGAVLFRDGASGEVIPIRRAEDIRTFGVVVRVSSEFD